MTPLRTPARFWPIALFALTACSVSAEAPSDPPADNPPVDNPPVDNPPVDNPPVDNPPVDNPPVDDPPVEPLPETWCAPQASLYFDYSPLEVPTIVRELAAGLSCEEIVERVGQGGEAHTTRRFFRDGEVVVVEEQRRQGWHRVQRFTFGAGGVLIAAEDQRGDDPAQANSWRYDARGRLLELRSNFREVDQRFESGRIVERRVRENQRGERVLTWRYDEDGRLLAAHSEIQGNPEFMHEGTQRVSFDYDAAGRIAEVQRFVDDRLAMRQSWQFDDEDELRERLVISSLGGIEGASPIPQDQQRPYMGGLDSLEPGEVSARGGSFESNPWPDSRIRAEGNCRRLPTSVVHGHPDADVEYQLGWPATERPHGIGFAYGYDGFGWFYGDTAWYGHGGVGSSILVGVHPWIDGRLESRIVYDEARRMVEEQATVHYNVEGEDPVRTDTHRRRSFDANGLRSDRIEATTFEGDAIARALEFEHDANGRLTRRSLFAGERLLEFQTWDWHPSGRVAEHVVHLQPNMQRQRIVPVDPAQLQPPALSRRWQRDHDDAGRLVRERVERAEPAVPASVRELDYDAAGRLTRERFDENGDGDFERSRAIDYDADGRVLSESTEHGEQRSFEYTCQ